MPFLELDGLRVHYTTERGPVKAVDGVSLSLEKGEALGLAGESGCGKTTVALSVLRILPSAGKIVDGHILFEGQDLTKLSDSQMRKIRWKRISLVFQGAMNALNPVFKVGDQIIEAIKTHEPGISRQEAHERTERLLEMVGIDPSRAGNYPHEFSGGMRQRALIAMALALSPPMLVADEPGTALDVIVQAQVLKLMRDLKEKLDLSMILITHDLSIIAETCEKVAIMYGGKIMEYGSVESVFKEPLHPYTQGLIAAVPKIQAARQRLASVPGQPPDLLYPPPACRFHPRCPYIMDICKLQEPPPARQGTGDHYVACHLYPS